MSYIDAAVALGTEILGDELAPYALLFSPSRAIGTIIADVTVREVHNDTNTVTAFPVEGGTPVSDHMFANPKLVEISCGFSDSSAGFPGYVQQVYEAFQALDAQREPFDVSTGKRFYQSMVFSEINVVTDEESEYALMVTARLQKVTITNTDSSATVDNQANPAATAPETNVGNQSLQPAGGVSGINAGAGSGDTVLTPLTGFGHA